MDRGGIGRHLGCGPTTIRSSCSLAEVRDIDDEAAFRLADLENRARQDITEFERAKNYAAALPMHYDGKQTKMAERLNISKGLLSKMIAFANISDKIMVAFAVPGELSLRQGYSLAQAVSTPAAETRASRAAGGIVKENAAHVEAGKGALPDALSPREAFGGRERRDCGEG